MPFSIGSTGSSRIFARFNSKAGRWYVRGLDGNDVEIQNPNFVADLDNIATGWLRFREGQAPERVIDPSIDTAAPFPGEGFKRGFIVMTFSPKFFGGAAEFASASAHISNAIKEVYAAYEAAKADNAGRLPVVSCTGSQPMKDKFGTNFRPTLAIVQWVDRPADLPNRSPVEPSDVWKGAAPSPRAPAQHVAPPAVKQATHPLAEAVF
mgnify:CR=1 FL=1